MGAPVDPLDSTAAPSLELVPASPWEVPPTETQVDANAGGASSAYAHPDGQCSASNAQWPSAQMPLRPSFSHCSSSSQWNT